MRIVTKDNKLYVSFIKEEVDAIKKADLKPVEIDRDWLPLLIDDVGKANLEFWHQKLNKEYVVKKK